MSAENVTVGSGARLSSAGQGFVEYKLPGTSITTGGIAPGYPVHVRGSAKAASHGGGGYRLKSTNTSPPYDSLENPLMSGGHDFIINGNLTIRNGAALGFGGGTNCFTRPNTYPPFSLAGKGAVVKVGGGVVLEAPAKTGLKNELHVFAGHGCSVVAEDVGGVLEIGRQLKLGTNSWVYTASDPYFGESVNVTVGGKVTIDPNAGFNASGLGYSGGISPVSEWQKNGYGPGAISGRGRGGAYGGLGGWSVDSTTATFPPPGERTGRRVRQHEARGDRRHDLLGRPADAGDDGVRAVSLCKVGRTILRLRLKSGETPFPRWQVLVGAERAGRPFHKTEVVFLLVTGASGSQCARDICQVCPSIFQRFEKESGIAEALLWNRGGV